MSEGETASSTSSARVASPPMVPRVAAASMPRSPPELGTVTLLTFLMMFPLQAEVMDSGSTPSAARASAAA